MKRAAFTVILSLMTICGIPKAHSQDPSGSKVPGCSACLYYGSINEVCGITTVPISSLPTECTALMFMCLTADDNLNVADGSGIEGDETYLQAVGSSGKPAFIYHGHTDIQAWGSALSCNVENGGVNAKTEMQNLKAYLDKYSGFTGIILEYLSYDPEEDPTPPEDLTANLKIYLDEMRTTFPDFGIGIELWGRKLKSYYSTKDAACWLDFTVLDSSIDFYTVNLVDFNVCTPDLKTGGIAPVTGSAPNTLENLVPLMVSAGIPKEKTYFQYGTEPVDTFNEDCSTLPTFCAEPCPDGVCTDTVQSYFEKGAFAKQNGAGFIAMNIDKGDDPDGCCGCGSPYPGFHAMLDGFNGAPAPATCPQLDKS